MVNIAILGFGTVGTGIVEILNKRGKIIEEEIGQDINIKKILVKNIKKSREIEVEDGVLTDNFKDILEDDDINIVVEVTSDIEESYDKIRQSLQSKKHVVTANKAIVSKYFEELSKLAEENQVAFLYEASVAGGIPIIKPLRMQILLNNIDRVQGILNGTCNYILDEMTSDSISYEEVIAKAQVLGYAEADPTADVNGEDTLRKLRILATLIMGGKVSEKDIILRGIETISEFDIDQFEKKDFSVKLIGQAKRESDGFTAIVEPCLIEKNTYFDNVGGAYNSVAISGEDIEDLKFYGPGAGKLPTANAVLSDILDISLDEYRVKSPLGEKELKNKNDNIEGEYYLRISGFEDIDDEDIDKNLNKISKELYIEGDSIVVWTKVVELKHISELLINIDEDKYFLAKLSD